MDVELPIALHLHRTGQARVIAVRIRDCSLTGTPLEGIEQWPEDRPLAEDNSDPTKDLLALRKSLKAWVVEVLKNERCRTPFAESKRLMLLDRFGRPKPAPLRTFLGWWATGAAAGALFGWTIGGLLPHRLDGIVSSTIVFAVLDSAAVEISWWLRALQLRRVDRSFFRDLDFDFGAIVAVGIGLIGLLRGACFGFVLGLVLGFAGWWLPFGHGGSALVCALLSGFQAAYYLRKTNTGRSLQVFLDVDDFSDLRQTPFAFNDAQEIDSQQPEASAPVVVDTQPPQCGDQADLGAHPWFGLEFRRWQDVALRALVLYHEEEINDCRQLLKAFEDEGVEDMYSIETLASGSLGTEKADFWRERLGQCDLLIILGGPALMRSQTHRALSETLAGRTFTGDQTQVVLIALEKLEGASAGLLTVQALPALPVHCWPVTENAWIHVVRRIRSRQITSFWLRLRDYHKSMQRRHIESGSIKTEGSCESNRRESHTETIFNDELEALSENIRTKHETDCHEYIWKQRYPYRHFEWTISKPEVVTWVCLGGISALGSMPHAALGPACVLSVLAWRREVRLLTGKELLGLRAELADNVGSHQESPWDGWVIKRAAIAAGVAALWALIVFLFSLSLHTRSGTFLLGAVAGLGAYLGTTRRVPKVLLNKPAPDENARKISFGKLGIRIEGPIHESPETSGNIGRIAGLEPDLFSRTSGVRCYSIGSFLRSCGESLAIVAIAATAARWLIASSRLPAFIAVLLACMIMEVEVTWLINRRVIRWIFLRQSARIWIRPLIAVPAAWGALYFFCMWGLSLAGFGARDLDFNTAVFVCAAPAFALQLWLHHSYVVPQGTYSSRPAQKNKDSDGLPRG